MQPYEESSKSKRREEARLGYVESETAVTAKRGKRDLTDVEKAWARDRGQRAIEAGTEHADRIEQNGGNAHRAACIANALGYHDTGEADRYLRGCGLWLQWETATPRAHWEGSRESKRAAANYNYLRAGDPHLLDGLIPDGAQRGGGGHRTEMNPHIAWANAVWFADGLRRCVRRPDSARYARDAHNARAERHSGAGSTDSVAGALPSTARGGTQDESGVDERELLESLGPRYFVNEMRQRGEFGGPGGGEITLLQEGALSLEGLACESVVRGDWLEVHRRSLQPTTLDCLEAHRFSLRPAGGPDDGVTPRGQAGAAGSREAAAEEPVDEAADRGAAAAMVAPGGQGL